MTHWEQNACCLKCKKNMMKKFITKLSRPNRMNESLVQHFALGRVDYSCMYLFQKACDFICIDCKNIELFLAIHQDWLNQWMVDFFSRTRFAQMISMKIENELWFRIRKLPMIKTSRWQWIHNNRIYDQSIHENVFFFIPSPSVNVIYFFFLFRYKIFFYAHLISVHINGMRLW